MSKHASPELSFDQLAKALEEAYGDTADCSGRTLRELAEESHIHRERVRRMLGQAIALGLWELCPTRKRTIRIDGVVNMTPAYRPVRPPNKKGQK